MKKILVIALVSIVFGSCTKEYSCECTDQATTQVNTMLFRTNAKSHANRLCNDWGTRTRAAVPDRQEVTCAIK